MQTLVESFPSMSLEDILDDKLDDPTDDVSVNIAEQLKKLAISAQVHESQAADFKRLPQSVQRELCLRKQSEMTQADIRDIIKQNFGIIALSISLKWV